MQPGRPFFPNEAPVDEHAIAAPETSAAKQSHPIAMWTAALMLAALGVAIWHAAKIGSDGSIGRFTVGESFGAVSGIVVCVRSFILSCGVYLLFKKSNTAFRLTALVLFGFSLLTNGSELYMHSMMERSGSAQAAAAGPAVVGPSGVTAADPARSEGEPGHTRALDQATCERAIAAYEKRVKNFHHVRELSRQKIESLKTEEWAGVEDAETLATHMEWIRLECTMISNYTTFLSNAANDLYLAFLAAGMPVTEAQELASDTTTVEARPDVRRVYAVELEAWTLLHNQFTLLRNNRHSWNTHSRTGRVLINDDALLAEMQGLQEKRVTTLEVLESARAEAEQSARALRTADGGA